MSYNRVLEAMVEHDLDWNDVDRIELKEETYAEFTERAGDKVTSNYATNNAPAVRETQKEEKLVYVAPNGIMVTVPL